MFGVCSEQISLLRRKPVSPSRPAIDRKPRLVYERYLALEPHQTGRGIN
jgi:hypothetical protein